MFGWHKKQFCIFPDGENRLQLQRREMEEVKV